MTEEKSASEAAETLPPAGETPASAPARPSWVGLGVAAGVSIGSAAVAAALLYATKRRRKK